MRRMFTATMSITEICLSYMISLSAVTDAESRWLPWATAHYITCHTLLTDLEIHFCEENGVRCQLQGSGETVPQRFYIHTESC